MFSGIPAFRSGRTRVLSGTESAIMKFFSTFLFTLFLLLLPFIVYKSEKSKYAVTQDISNLKPLIIENPQKIKENDIVHLSSDSVISETISDYDFGVQFSDTFKVERYTEYCQWVETFVDETVRDAQDEERTTRSYYYHKTWQNYRVMSLLFDQPAAHYNPQYDPLPSRSLPLPKIEIPVADQNLIISPLLVSSLGSYSRRVKDLKIVDHESRAKELRFRYIGDGYFYYTHKASWVESILKLGGEFIEGSLLDYQIGDLFSQCNAGDIRVSYTQTPTTSGISLIATLQPPNTLVPVKNLQLIKPKSNASADELISDLLSTYHWNLVFTRLLLLLWSFGVHEYFNAGEKKSFMSRAASVLGGAGIMSGLVIVLVWGLDVFGGGMVLGGALLMIIGNKKVEKENKKKE